MNPAASGQFVEGDESNGRMIDQHLHLHPGAAVDVG
jgi:hypothetical protein